MRCTLILAATAALLFVPVAASAQTAAPMPSTKDPEYLRVLKGPAVSDAQVNQICSAFDEGRRPRKTMGVAVAALSMVVYGPYAGIGAMGQVIDQTRIDHNVARICRESGYTRVLTRQEWEEEYPRS